MPNNTSDEFNTVEHLRLLLSTLDLQLKGMLDEGHDVNDPEVKVLVSRIYDITKRLEAIGGF